MGITIPRPKFYCIFVNLCSLLKTVIDSGISTPRHNFFVDASILTWEDGNLSTNTHMRFQSHLWAVGVSTISFLLEAQTIIIMSSNKRSHPDHFVGLLCYKCKRTDFGGSARRLSSHVRYCNGPPQQSYYQKKRRRFSTLTTASLLVTIMECHSSHSTWHIET